MLLLYILFAGLVLSAPRKHTHKHNQKGFVRAFDVSNTFTFNDDDFKANAQVPYQITDYGTQILQNKLTITAIMNSMSLSVQLQSLIMAMAFQETVTLSANDRDRSKDGTSSENVSLWNLSVGLVNTVSPGTDPESLNTDIGATIQVIIQGLNYYGLETYLDAVRGGGTAILDHVSYGVQDYRNSIKTIYDQIMANPQYLVDSNRVEVIKALLMCLLQLLKKFS